jgi:two-component system, sensor histidine kinase YesM
MSLRTKLFGAFLAFIILPLVVLGIAAYHVLTGIIEEKYSQQSELTLRALSQNVGFTFQEMNKVTDSTIASDSIQDVLNNRYADGKDIHETDYMELNEVQRKFRELLVNHPSVSYAFMYTFENNRVNEIFTKESFTAMPFETFKQQPLYWDIMNRQGLPLWVGPYENPELTGTGTVFTQIRVVKDIDTLNDKGMLLVQIKNSGLESVFRYFRYKQEQYATRFLIANSLGLVLYDSTEGRSLNGRYIQEFTDSQLNQGDPSYHSGRSRFEGQDSVISSLGLGIEDWRLVSVTSWKSLSSEVNLYAKWLAAIILICLASACIFILFFANRLAKQVIRTVKFMRKVERGDLTARLPVKGKDEMSLLAKGFNSLVERVSELLNEVMRQQERKKHAELQALQAQIKPHFLFNALESINILAVQNQGRKVSQMVARLGNMLRISIQQKELITVEQELQHLCSYLEIQKFRFEELFDFEFDIPPGLLTCTMPKLTLQPLVENSIQHGFEGIEYMGKIRISARKEEERLAFYVEDNGIGIPQDQLASFEYEREGGSAFGESPETGERRGLGVCNVADRIRIGYGSSYGLFICSGAGSGTVIKLVIPITAGSVIYEAEGASGRRRNENIG